ncbi:MAG: thioredoxin domain-containing protein [Rhodospirillaceae bacterium]
MSDGTNRLGGETSPYLLQHKDNPVHWWPWSGAAMAAARETGRPVLLSVGYAACHWCHVMAHESFEDEATAALMNELFVNVKVDREERPDVDALYQAALQMMGEQGGWPLTIFVTPDGEPFWGGTYFPPTARYGRPGFKDVLKSIAGAYAEQRDQIATSTASMKDALKRLAKPEGGGELTMPLVDRAATTILRAIDPITGGTMGAPKFPQPSLHKLLWRAHRRRGASMFREAVTLSLDHMCQGGIYDHLGGGFARYSTDEVWLAPHFEKMLYDNALLVELMCDVWAVTRSPLYAVRIEETIGWALREMMASGADGPLAFVSAYDADSEGKEGKFYVWSEAEIDALLGDDATRFKAHYDVTRFGNWEGHTILNRSRDMSLADAETEAALAKSREILFAVRAKRVWPSRDDKVLADWNGLMIAALCRAAVTFDRTDWLQAAEDAFAFVVTRMSADADSGRLLHSWCDAKARHPGVLEDYANMARAALALFEVTGAADYLQRAKGWAAVANEFFWDKEHGGYFISASDTADIMMRTKPIHDNATPPGNGVMANVLARLYHLTGDDDYRGRFDALVRALVPAGLEHVEHQTSLLMAFELMAEGVQTVIVGEDQAGAMPSGLALAALQAAPPASVLLRASGADDLPADHPAKGKQAIDGKPTAYVCVGQTCSLPITDAAALRQRLEGGQS